MKLKQKQKKILKKFILSQNQRDESRNIYTLCWIKHNGN